jgi:hypothetical protein
VKQIVVARNASTAPNRDTLEVFALGANGQVYSNTQQQSGGSWGGWGALNSTPPPNTLFQIAVAINSSAPTNTTDPDSLEVFGVDGGFFSQSVYSDTQNSPGGRWNGWGPVGTVP